MPSYSFTYLFSSAISTGAIVDSNSGGSKFSIDMGRYPIRMPTHCKNVTISCVSASIPYVTPNITAGINNYFYFNYLGINYILQLPTGLYSLNTLQSQISVGLLSLSLPNNLFTFIGNTSTQTTSIQFNYANSYIDFTQPFNFGFILGYNTITPVIPSTLGQITTAPQTANFDTLKAYVISTDLTSGNGIPINGRTSRGVVALIPIDSQPGSRLTYSPSLMVIVNCNELIGQTRTYANFEILNQNGESISMLNQEWSVLLQFTYDL